MSKGSTSAALAGLRSVVVIVAMAGVGLGGWILHTVDDAEIRGSAIMDMSPIGDGEKEQWQKFLNTAVDSKPRIWIAVAANCSTFLAGLFIFCSLKMDRLKVSRYVLTGLELLTALAMAGALVASLTFAMRLSPSCAITESPSIPGMEANEMLCPISKGYSIATGIGLLLLTCTCLLAVIDVCQRARQKKNSSFEPTASALGMGHGYQAVAPRTQRGAIPTLYDPDKPAPGLSEPPRSAVGKGFHADFKEETIRRDSALSHNEESDDKDISGPLGLEKPETVQQMRPARPWSEMPKRG